MQPAPPPPPAPPRQVVDYTHWPGVEVVLPSGEHAAVRSVGPDGTATVAVGLEDGQGSFVFPPSAALRSGVPLAAAKQAPVATMREQVKVVGGDCAGQFGETMGADGNDVVVKLGSGMVLIMAKQLMAKRAAES